MPYSAMYYHAIWATKNRADLIDEDREKLIRQSLQATCRSMGIVCFAIGMVSDHVHVAVSVPPKHALADTIGRLKGASSHLVRSHPDNRPPFGWQEEYGVLTLTKSVLPVIVDYVTDQRKRHAENQLHPGLERIE